MIAILRIESRYCGSSRAAAPSHRTTYHAALRARLRRSARRCRGDRGAAAIDGWPETRCAPAPFGIAHAPGAGHSTLRPMGDPRCHHCGHRRARRCHRVGALERVLSAVYVYPFRCQVCGRRFRALAWGKRYVRRSADHRELERVAIRAPVVLRSGHVSAPGEATELSLDGFTAKTAARLGVGASVSVTLDLVAGEPPIEVEEAVAQSTRDDAIGVQFVRLQPGERRRLQRVVVDLYPRSHDATVPPAPDLPDERKLRILYSVDFWLVALAVVLVLVAWLRLFPWSG